MKSSIKIVMVSLIVTIGLATLAEATPINRDRRAQSVRATPSNRRPTQLSEQLRQLPGASHFTRDERLHIALKSGNPANKALMRLPNTVEFFVKKGYGHLFVRVKGVTFDRHTSVKATPWDKFEKRNTEQSGVLLQLPRPLYKQFVKHLSAAKKDPSGTVGSFIYEGGTFPQNSNCTSWVTLAKMGDKKLIEALGIPRGASGISSGKNPTRHPQSWVNALIDHSPYTQAVIIRNHEKISAEEAKVDLGVSGSPFIR